MTATTILLGLVAAATWTWILGDHFDWWHHINAELLIKFSHQSKELGHAQEVLHRAWP